MVNSSDNPIEWSLINMEIEELIEHIQDLSSEMSQKGKIEDIEFEVQIGHAYAHLNRIWNARNHVGEVNDKAFQLHSLFPTDIAPVG